MPVSVEIYHERQLVLVTGTGALGLTDMTNYFTQLTVNNTLPYRKLFDGTRSYLDLSGPEIELLRGTVRAMRTRGTRGPLAIVATTPKGIAGAHLFMNIPARDRITRLFDSYDHALEWLLQQPLQASALSLSD